MDNQALAILAAILLFGALLIGVIINRDMGGEMNLASMTKPPMTQQSMNHSMPGSMERRNAGTDASSN